MGLFVHGSLKAFGHPLTLWSESRNLLPLHNTHTGSQDNPCPHLMGSHVLKKSPRKAHCIIKE